MFCIYNFYNKLNNFSSIPYWWGGYFSSTLNWSMWKVLRVRHLEARPQIVLGLVIAVAALAGVHTTALPSNTHVVVSDRRPQVAAAFMLPSPPEHPPVDCSVAACLALTFDDGPRHDTTSLALDALARHHARATFFVLGSHVKGNEQIIRRMYQEGHEIGNHSWNHPHFTALSPELMREQINSTQAAITEVGVPAPKLFRPPYGDVNSAVESVVPMTIALWNVDPEDWNYKQPEEIVTLVKSYAGPGRVIVMHDTYRPTAETLDRLVAELQKDYHLVTFSELFNLTAGQPGRYYGR
jgi:peptidoglycan/xylan/chitin deacetylase (PgdA/CDA1 family)